MSKTVSAQGMMEIFKLLDKELVNKIMDISKTISVEKLEGGITRISIDLVSKP